MGGPPSTAGRRDGPAGDGWSRSGGAGWVPSFALAAAGAPVGALRGRGGPSANPLGSLSCPAAAVEVDELTGHRGAAGGQRVLGLGELDVGDVDLLGIDVGQRLGAGERVIRRPQLGDLVDQGAEPGLGRQVRGAESQLGRDRQYVLCLVNAKIR